MKYFAALLLLFCTGLSRAQSLYFPPLTGSTWETTDPATLGWCPDKIDSLLTFLDDTDSKAFLLLKDGKIVIEHYFGTFTRDSVWYWASAGKTITSMLVGIAQEDGLLDISQPTSTYLGTGWTSLTPAQESAITVRHQLSMSTGLDDGAGDPDCTLPSCLVYKAAPGTRWAYHNAPYTLLDSVIRNTTGQTLNQYTTQKIKTKTGMTGLWVKSGYNNVFVSTARSMARYGILMQNGGQWNTQTVLGDTAYFRQMTHTSQTLNRSYGYLWWLAGQSSFMIPQSQLVFNGSAMPAAPNDVIAALGKNGQILNISPGTGLVLVRMGQQPDGQSFYISNVYNDKIWQHVNALSCNSSSVSENTVLKMPIIFPNPAEDMLYLSVDNQIFEHTILYNNRGQKLREYQQIDRIDVSELAPGLYFVRRQTDNAVQTSSFIKK